MLTSQFCQNRSQHLLDARLNSDQLTMNSFLKQTSTNATITVKIITIQTHLILQKSFLSSSGNKTFHNIHLHPQEDKHKLHYKLPEPPKNPTFRSPLPLHIKRRRTRSSTLTPDAAGKLNIFRHYRHTLRMNRTQIRIFKQSHEIRLSRFLKGGHSRALKSKICLEILRNLTHQALEREFSDEKLRALLVFPDLPQGDCTRTESMGFFHATGRRS